jgi:hypothetical protein
MFELVSSRSREATRRAVCHLRPGQRGLGANQTNRDFAGTLGRGRLLRSGPPRPGIGSVGPAGGDRLGVAAMVGPRGLGMVATGDATIRLADGQVVTVDGGAGTVHSHD